MPVLESATEKSPGATWAATLYSDKEARVSSKATASTEGSIRSSALNNSFHPYPDNVTNSIRYA